MTSQHLLCLRGFNCKWPSLDAYLVPFSRELPRAHNHQVGFVLVDDQLVPIDPLLYQVVLPCENPGHDHWFTMRIAVCTIVNISDNFTTIPNTTRFTGALSAST